jgi:hypothetical protein
LTRVRPCDSLLRSKTCQLIGDFATKPLACHARGPLFSSPMVRKSNCGESGPGTPPGLTCLNAELERFAVNALGRRPRVGRACPT